MRISWDKKGGCSYVTLSSQRGSKQNYYNHLPLFTEVGNGIIVIDFSKQNFILGIELCDGSQYFSNELQRQLDHWWVQLGVSIRPTIKIVADTAIIYVDPNYINTKVENTYEFANEHVKKSKIKLLFDKNWKFIGFEATPAHILLDLKYLGVKT